MTESASGLDLLLFHGWFLAHDPLEQELMRPFPPLGLQYLVGWLREHGFPDVDWWDASFCSGPESFEGELESRRPRVVGLYGHTVTRPTSLPMVKQAVRRGCRVIAGGPDPVQYLDEYLEGGVEVVVIGEGEHTLTELMEHLRAHQWNWHWESLGQVAGIAFRHPQSPDGEITRTPTRMLIRPLDSIPWPVRERRDLSSYFDAWRARHGETAMSMVTSRGCPYHCTWCSKQVYGDTFRRRSTTDVLNELEDIRLRFDPDQIWFADDLFTINRKWVHRFCKEVHERGIQIPFYCIGRPESLSASMVADLANAGLYRMYLSAESGVQHVLDAMKKGDTVDDIRRGVRLLRAHGIEVGLFVMIGYPGESHSDLSRTVEMLHELEADVNLISVAHPMKGTAFYEEVADRVIRPPGWEKENGGRLAFEMDYPHRFYSLAQRAIRAELALVGKLRNGGADRDMLGMLSRLPAYRAGMRMLTRQTAR